MVNLSKKRLIRFKSYKITDNRIVYYYKIIISQMHGI